MFELTTQTNTYYTTLPQDAPDDQALIRLDPSQDIRLLKHALNTTFEYASQNNQRIVLDPSVDDLPGYKHDCIWSVRHEKDPKTDLKTILKAMVAQTIHNTGQEIRIEIQ